MGWRCIWGTPMPTPPCWRRGWEVPRQGLSPWAPTWPWTRRRSANSHRRMLRWLNTKSAMVNDWLCCFLLSQCLFSLLTLQSYFAPFSYSPTFLHPPSPLTHSLTCFQAFSDFIAHLDKLAGAIHPLLDAPPVDIPGATAGSLRKRLAAAKTLRPIIKCGEFSYTVRLTHSVPALFSVVTKS